MYPVLKSELEPFRVTFGEERGIHETYTITRPIMISAMSYGALGEKAVRSLARGAKRAGIAMNTGEGGHPKYHLSEGCDLIFQMGTAKFGVRNDDGTLDDDDRYPVIPQRFVADVRSALPKDGIVTLDNGIYKVWFARNYPVREPNTLLLDNALATMGAGLPSAMGAKIVHPEKQVIAVCGDGGFMMNSQEMETAVRLKLDLVVLVLRDNAYGMIKWKQTGMGFQNWGLDYGNPDFVAYAKSYGANGVRIESTADFLPTLKSALAEGGVWLVELPVDYSENERVLIKELQEKACVL